MQLFCSCNFQLQKAWRRAPERQPPAHGADEEGDSKHARACSRHALATAEHVLRSRPPCAGMARTKKNVDPFEFHGSDDESDDDDKLGAKRKRRNSGSSTPHSVNGLDDGGGSPCRDEDGGRSTCRAKLCFPGSGNQSDTAASGTLTPPLPHARELRQRRGELHRFLRCVHDLQLRSVILTRQC